MPPSAIDQSLLVDKSGKLRVPEKSLDGWSLGFIGPRLWNHLKDAWGVNGPVLTEGKFLSPSLYVVLLANANIDIFSILDDAQGEEYEEIRMRLKLWKQSLKSLAVSPN